MDDMEERAAIVRLKAGNMRALDHLVRKYQVRAIRSATLITRDRALAEDIVQEAFVRAYERIDQLDLQRSFGPWFLKSVVNAALKAAMQQARQVPLADDEELEARMLIDPEPGPEERLAQAELVDEIGQALDALSPKQRAAVVLRYYVGLSEAEMAEKLGSSPGTVKRHLYNARQRLAQLLRRVPLSGMMLP